MLRRHQAAEAETNTPPTCYGAVRTQPDTLACDTTKHHMVQHPSPVMRRRPVLALLVVLLFVSSLPAVAQGLLDAPPEHGAIAIEGVTVLPMDEERLLPDYTVVVRDGRIAEIGPAASVVVPDGELRIDGAGQYLMPGLAEMHAHIPSPQQGDEALERTLFLFLANGVTTLRGMLGHPQHLELRESSNTGAFLPRVYTSSPSLNGNSAPTPEDGRRLVAEHHAAGYDFLKIHPGLSRETYDAVVETASELGIDWAGHVPANVALNRALDAGQLTIDHLDAYVEALAGHGDGFSQEDAGFFGVRMTDDANQERIAELVAATREAGVWNVPTQALMEHLLSPDEPEEMAAWPEMRYVPRQALDQWAQAKRNIRAQAETPERAALYLEIRRAIIGELHEQGAELLLGADAPQIYNVPGFSTHRELQYMVDSGLSPYEALATGTRNPATFFGSGEWGTIGEGMIADLVLVSENPLADVRNAGQINGVMVRGMWLSGDEIEARLSRLEAALAE